MSIDKTPKRHILKFRQVTRDPPPPWQGLNNTVANVTPDVGRDAAENHSLSNNPFSVLLTLDQDNNPPDTVTSYQKPSLQHSQTKESSTIDLLTVFDAILTDMQGN